MPHHVFPGFWRKITWSSTHPVLRIVFDAVTPSVYTTPIETVAETVSIWNRCQKWSVFKTMRFHLSCKQRNRIDLNTFTMLVRNLHCSISGEGVQQRWSTSLNSLWRIAMPRHVFPGFWRKIAWSSTHPVLRIVFDAVTPSVYTTPIETVAETVSIWNRCQKWSVFNCLVNSETASLWIRLLCWREICIVQLKIVNLARSAALAYTITTWIFWRKRFRVNTSKQHQFWRGIVSMWNRVLLNAA